VTPVWFVYLDETWWISCESSSVKVRNVLVDPRVALMLENGDEPVVAEGRTRVHRGPFPQRIIEAFAAKYDGWDIEGLPTSGADRVLFEVPVSRWLLSGAAQ